MSTACSNDSVAYTASKAESRNGSASSDPAHGRLTGYVLLALPAFLAIALMFINPEHMNLLFRERMGQMMLMGAIAMQTFGFMWIKKIVKIEV